MNVKKNFLFLIIGLLMTFLLPQYANAGFTFSALDTQGKLLSFANPAKISGTGATNGDGAASVGAKYKYTNVITVGTTRVDAIVTVDAIVNATLNTFDDANPNPTGSSRAGGGKYTTSFGVVVSEAAVFAPQITSLNRTQDAYVKFTINFVDSTGAPVVLKNVYNNTLDDESVEYNSYGGFQSYRVASDNLTNAKRIIATPGLNGSIRFSSTDCTGDMGLYIKDQSRVQTKFDTITSLTITNGQFANGKVPKVGGGFSTCTNSSIRYYGAIFAQDQFIDTPGTVKEYTAPTVDLLTTNDTTPTLTGTLGGEVSTASPKGSALSGTDTFSVNVAGATYTAPNSNLVLNGVNWTLNIPTALTSGISYEVIATRNGTLVDQTTNELIITPTCTSNQILNSTQTACIPPPPGKVTICHSGNGKHYVKISIDASGENGHETHEYDKEADSFGKCPDDIKTCDAPQILNEATNTCETPVASCETIEEITAANSSEATIPPKMITSVTTYKRNGQIKKVSSFVNVCHAQQLTAGAPYPYALKKIKKSDVDNHIITQSGHTRNVDYYPLTGACPTVMMPCPGTTCDLPRRINPSNNLCEIPPDPSVDYLTTADVTPVITGWVGGFKLGDGENLRVTINGQTYYYNYGNLHADSPELQVIDDQRWILNIPDSAPLSIGTTYDVLVVQDDDNLVYNGNENTDNTGTENGTPDEVTVVTPPTVVSQVTLNTKPTITGTVGNVGLVGGEMFTVEVNGRVYSTTNAAYPLTVTGTTWTLNVIDELPTGMTYGILAIRNQYLADETNGELIIPDPPTVESQTTTNTRPLIKGTAGKTGMAASESFSVTINGKTYTKPNANLKIIDITTSTAIDDKGNIEGTLTNWELQIPAGDPALTTTSSPYTVVATRFAPMNTGSGTVSIIGVPTVVKQAVADTKPTVTGTVGTAVLGASETFTVAVGGVTYTKDDGKLSVNGLNWTLVIPTDLTMGTTYDVTATRGGTAVDTTSGELIIVSVPTVQSQTTSNMKPTITGTVGNAALNTIGGVDEAFSVTVHGTTYTKSNGLTINNVAKTWSLAMTTALPVGTYNVDALRNGKLADTTTGELIIGGTAPTVDVMPPTNDTTPTITGTFGTNPLEATETFTVKVNGVTYTLGDGNLAKGGALTWSLTIPEANALPNGTYPVDAVRNGNLFDTSTDELTVAVKVPTVDKPQTFREKVAVILKGTVGDVALNTNDTFKVTVNGHTYSKGQAALVIPANSLAWTLNVPTTDSIPVGVYDVVATRAETLVDTSTGELTIEALSPPTVESQTTFDTTPVIKGTVGTSALETNEAFTVLVNGKTYTKGVDANLVVTGLDWTLTILTGNEIPGKATPYDVVATRGTAPDAKTGTGQLTIQPCALPKVVNAKGDACIDPVPTVEPQTLTDHVAVAPVIHGTVGEVVLGSTEKFSVTIKTPTPQVYNHTTPETDLKITGMDWTLTVPLAKAIPAGTYDVEAARNTTAIDKTTNELIINLVCLTGETAVDNSRCVANSFFPTVDSLSTADTTPAITGKVGDSVLAIDEPFTVSVNGVTYHNGDGNLVVNGSSWALTIPAANALPEGTYDVAVLRNNMNHDTSTNELTITACESPKVVNTTTGDCTEPNLVPTVTPSASHGIKDPSIVVAGTVGDIPLTTKELTDNAFTVTVTEHGNSSHRLAGALVVSGTTWTFTLTKPEAGTFDVNAVRGTKADETNSELVITDNIAICENNIDKSIPKSSWDGTKEGTNYYLGTCTPSGETLPISPTAKAEKLPDDPIALVNQYAPVAGLEYCADGGVKSDSPTTGTTIKRATIVNASTEGGTIDLVGLPTKVKYGLKTPAIGTMDISAAQIVGGNKAIGATLTGVTLDDVYIDTATDFVDSAGSVISGGTYIKVTGGTTKPTTTKEDMSITHGTITSGMIIAGTDAAGNPVRGSVTTGLYDVDIVNTNSVTTKGRRTRGKLENATIENATTTSVAGVTVVDAGTITSGQVVTGSTSPASTFGTVLNATLTGVTISNSNHCFSSGTVGSKGQLNWKEVVKH